MTEPENDSSSALGDIGLEAEKTRQSIIALWKEAIKDDDPGIRLFTIGLSGVAFILVSIFLLALLESIVSGFAGDAPQFDKYLYSSIACSLMSIPIAIPAAIRITQRAEIHRLDQQFEKILAALEKSSPDR